MREPLSVLFLCTGNSARSILAEGYLTHLGSGRFKAYSAGSHPRGVVHPMALQTLKEDGVKSSGFRSKSWDEFAGPKAVPLDVVITVCDDAAGETCPIWSGRPVTLHWGLPDPASVEGPEDLRRAAFRRAATTLRARIERLVVLPVEELGPADLAAAVRGIAGP